MSHEFRIDREAGLVIEVFSGSLDLNVLTQANTAIVSHPDFVERLNFLTDLRGAQVDFGYDKMIAHVTSLPRLHISRQAFVITQSTVYGLVRMFITLSEGSEVFGEARIFENSKEGLAWLNS